MSSRIDNRYTKASTSFLKVEPQERMLEAFLKTHPGRTVFPCGVYDIDGVKHELPFPLVVLKIQGYSFLLIGKQKPLGSGGYGAVYLIDKIAGISSQGSLEKISPESSSPSPYSLARTCKLTMKLSSNPEIKQTHDFENVVIKIIKFDKESKEDPMVDSMPNPMVKSFYREKKFGAKYSGAVLLAQKDKHAGVILSVKRGGRTLEALRKSLDLGSEQLTFAQRVCLVFKLFQECGLLLRGNILHHDLSPKNIMVRKGGNLENPVAPEELKEPEVKIIDFGLATERVNLSNPPVVSLTNLYFGALEIHKALINGEPYTVEQPEKASDERFAAAFDDSGAKTDMASLGKLSAYVFFDKCGKNRFRKMGKVKAYANGRSYFEMEFTIEDFNNVPEVIRDVFYNFLCNLCTRCPSERLDFYQAYLFLSVLYSAIKSPLDKLIDITPAQLIKLWDLSLSQSQRQMKDDWLWKCRRLSPENSSIQQSIDEVLTEFGIGEGMEKEEEKQAIAHCKPMVDKLNRFQLERAIWRFVYHMTVMGYQKNAEPRGLKLAQYLKEEIKTAEVIFRKKIKRVLARILGCSLILALVYKSTDNSIAFNGALGILLTLVLTSTLFDMHPNELRSQDYSLPGSLYHP
jgi:serine/threonine protein kinase